MQDLGKALLNQAINYYKESEYKRIFLETTDDQKRAIKMYIEAGFKKVAERETMMWGKKLVEQTYELNREENAADI